MSYNQGSISLDSPAGAPSGFINVAGARNGASIDSSNYVVLGQDLNAAGDPAKLLSNREIPQQNFYVNLWGGTTVHSLTRHTSMGLGIPLEVYDTFSGIAGKPALYVQQSVPTTSSAAQGLVCNSTDTLGAFLGAPSVFQAQRNGHPIFIVELNGTVSYNDTRDSTTSVGLIFFSPTSYLNRPLQNGKLSTLGLFPVWQPTTGAVSQTLNDILVSPTINFNTTDSYDYASIRIAGTWQQTATSGTNIRGISITPTINAALAQPFAAVENYQGNVYLCSMTSGTNLGYVSIRLGQAFTGNDPTAFLQIGPSTGNAGDTPLKLTPGTLVAAPEDGSFEYDGTHLYFTIGVTRTIII